MSCETPAAPAPGRHSARSPCAARRRVLGLAVVAALVVAASMPGRHPVLLARNASDSVPPGWYRIEATDRVAVGDIVLVHLPAEAAALAARRGYLPAGVPLLKTVSALAGQKVCVVGRDVRVDGAVVARALDRDRAGRLMPRWAGCRVLEAGEIMLLAPGHGESFDGRYFGPVTLDAVIGRARRLGPD